MCARVPVHVHQRVSSVWVQSRVRVHTWVFTRVDVCICVPVHTCVYVRSVWRQVSVSIHACLHVRMHASVHACLFPWLGACMCLCAHSVYKRLHTLWVYACALCAHMHVYTHGGICINVCVRPEVNPPPATACSPRILRAHVGGHREGSGIFAQGPIGGHPRRTISCRL